MSQNTSEQTHKNLFDRLIGPPLETAAAPHQAIGKIPALAVLLLTPFLR